MNIADTELGHQAIAELDAIKAEMRRLSLTPEDRLALQERLRAARALWEKAKAEAREESDR